MIASLLASSVSCTRTEFRVLKDYTQRRRFSSSWRRSQGHYETLQVPQNATKSQIKSSFYRMSKLYHPDVTKEPGAKVKFQAANDAYAVLGDDRKRRAYDRELQTSRTSASPGASHHHSPYQTPYHHYTTERRRGATHAWEYRRRASASHSHPHASHSGPYNYHRPGVSHGYDYHPNAQTHYYQQHKNNPWNTPYEQHRTTGKMQQGDWKQGPEERVQSISPVWRAVQLMGMMILVGSIGGGWSAHAI